MGIGITGYMQCTKTQQEWLDPLYEYIRDYDVQYSKRIGCNTSVKLTTVKPSGTLSLLAGVTSGCHPGIFQYFIRRIRISSGSNLIELCQRHGYYTEYQKNYDGSNDVNTTIVEFPCKYPDGTILAENMNAIDQLETIKYLQTYWSDNSISVTVYYKKEELDGIKAWLAENYTHNIKTVSFMLHFDSGFFQLPFESITREKYEELIQKVVPITNCNINIDSDEMPDMQTECAGGVCPIR
jgi:ribonucleoside-diphosphate reductase alpha chain/ribonucleoside-triphosphate reductase